LFCDPLGGLGGAAPEQVDSRRLANCTTCLSPQRAEFG